MNCPFCEKTLESVLSQCSYCGKDLTFLAQVAATASELKSKGDRAAERRDYITALSVYRSALRFQDSAETKSLINAIEKTIKRRLWKRMMLLGGIAVLWGLGVAILWLFSTQTPNLAIPNAAFENTPAGMTVHFAHKAFANQDWDLAVASLAKLSKKSPEWNWVVQNRLSEAEEHYVVEKIEEALAFKAAGDVGSYRRILTELAQKRLDNPEKVVFRLRRAEGLFLYEQLESSSRDQVEETLPLIISLFRPDELNRIYYVDDCLFQLGLIKERNGDEKAAAECFQLLIDRCPQGKWYWPAAKKYLDTLID